MIVEVHAESVTIAYGGRALVLGAGGCGRRKW